jgi:enamine deaminase RidA (YjgF/YER057c/UK114 family)
MTTPQFLNLGTVHGPGGYSHGVVASGRPLIVSGQVGFDKDRTVVGAGDFETQAIQAFDNLLAVLAEGGASVGDVVRLGVILSSRDHLAKLRGLPPKGNNSVLSQNSIFSQHEFALYSALPQR